MVFAVNLGGGRQGRLAESGLGRGIGDIVAWRLGRPCWRLELLDLVDSGGRADLLELGDNSARLAHRGVGHLADLGGIALNL